MSRRKIGHVDGQGQLSIVDGRVRRRKGRVEVATDKAIAAGHRDQSIDVRLDAAAAALARELAAAVDVAARKQDVWAVAQSGRQLSEQLIRLGLDPRARHTGPSDAVADALRELAQTQRDEPAVDGS